jgi:hypothetical protein
METTINKIRTAKKRSTKNNRPPQTHRELTFHLYNELRGANTDHVKVAEYISKHGYEAKSNRGINQAWVLVDKNVPQTIIDEAIKHATK